jgi:mannose-1-phosphate guanylyltransferase
MEQTRRRSGREERSDAAESAQPGREARRKNQLAVVIMAGGVGTRFWPLSTEARPKQFLRLFGERSLLQMSHDRIADVVPPERVLVLTNKRFAALVGEQLPDLPAENIIGEPHRRDTAAAIALAALLCERRLGAGTMAVLTADHLVEPVALFQSTLRSAVKACRDGAGALYTFGVKPAYPATGFGYLQRGELVLEDDGVEHYRLGRFREKPDRATAERYLESGEYYWNSGMFVWSTSAILGELRRHLPEHLARLAPAVARDGEPDFEEALARAFEPLTPISIDFGVMEKAEDVRCVAAGFRWSDVGGWLALEELLGRDGAGNASRGRTFAVDAGHNLVYCEDAEEVVALVGVEDLVVVRAGGRTLVAHRDRAEQIKQLVKQLDPELR